MEDHSSQHPQWGDSGHSVSPGSKSLLDSTGACTYPPTHTHTCTSTHLYLHINNYKESKYFKNISVDGGGTCAFEELYVIQKGSLKWLFLSLMDK